MLRAVYSFRPEKGYLFQTFASRVSENAMMDYVRKCVSAILTTGQMLSLYIEPYRRGCGGKLECCQRKSYWFFPCR